MASSSSAPNPRANLSCARCHISEETLGERLLNCGGCRSVQYCSKDCQKHDWPRHKAACRSIQRGISPDQAAPQSATRGTMRMNFGQFMQLGSDGAAGEGEEDDGTIYYLHTSTPHLHDISISGPYDSIRAVAHQMLHNFGAECRSGCETVRECRDTGTLAAMEHITSPIDGDQNRTRTCRIIKETNAAVKACLPGAVYHVVSMDVDMELGRQGVQGAVPGSTPVRRADSHGSFVDEAPAIDRARRIARETADGLSNGRVVDLGAAHNLVHGLGVLGHPSVTTMVSVRRDDGATA